MEGILVRLFFENFAMLYNNDWILKLSRFNVLKQGFSVSESVTQFLEILWVWKLKKVFRYFLENCGRVKRLSQTTNLRKVHNKLKMSQKLLNIFRRRDNEKLIIYLYIHSNRKLLQLKFLLLISTHFYSCKTNFLNKLLSL